VRLLRPRLEGPESAKGPAIERLQERRPRRTSGLTVPVRLLRDPAVALLRRDTNQPSGPPAAFGRGGGKLSGGRAGAQHSEQRWRAERIGRRLPLKDCARQRRSQLLWHRHELAPASARTLGLGFGPRK
jgi:hypothetical protein